MRFANAGKSERKDKRISNEKKQFPFNQRLENAGKTEKNKKIGGTQERETFVIELCDN